MTQKDKELLLKDLCARLPYRVKVLNSTFKDEVIQTLLGRISENEFNMVEAYKQVGGEDYGTVKDDIHYTARIDYIKPFLRPMSSMTEEENHTYWCMNANPGTGVDYIVFAPELIDWLNAHHFDYRGLIEKGLALEAPEGMYKI